MDYTNRVRLSKPSERLVRLVKAAEFRTEYQVRRKCFISYHGEDTTEVENFVEEFGAAFIPKIIGLTDDDPLIDSENDDYVMDQIREKYMTGTTVSIVLIGKCTWSRKFVDWEIATTLRNNKRDKRSGLLGIQLPSIDGTTPSIPTRLSVNLRKKDDDDAYARYQRHPSSEPALRGWIEDAFQARDTRDHLIKNSAALKRTNQTCD